MAHDEVRIKSGMQGMATEEERLCDACHSREAIHFICYGDTGETRNLCMTCFERLSSREELALHRQFIDRVRTGRCSYCGEPAVGGSGGQAELLLWCEACRLDLVEFASRPENDLSEPWPFDDEAAQERLTRELDERDLREQEFMRQRISERRSQGGD
jgi:protein-arginine kinase activator protein McsA